jgi:dTDP-4-dehydrorhamnose reductase
VELRETQRAVTPFGGRKTLILTIATADADRLARRPAYSVLSLASLSARGITMRSWQEAVHACLAELRHKGKLGL